MTPKEYLMRARYLDDRINSKIQQVVTLNELATKCTSTLSDMPKSSNRGGSRMEDAIIKIVALEEEINSDIDQLVDLKREIMCVIQKVQNDEYKTLLEKRYLCRFSWEQIAVDLNYSIQHIYRMHDGALREIEVVLQHESKCD